MDRGNKNESSFAIFKARLGEGDSKLGRASFMDTPKKKHVLIVVCLYNCWNFVALKLILDSVKNSRIY